MTHYRRGDPETGCFLLMLAIAVMALALVVVLR